MPKKDNRKLSTNLPPHPLSSRVARKQGSKLEKILRRISITQYPMKSKLLVSGLHRRAFCLQTPSYHSGSTGLRETALAFLATEPWSNHTPQSSSSRKLGRKECRQLPRSAQPRRKPRAYHSFLGPEWEEPDSQKKDFGSSET